MRVKVFSNMHFQDNNFDLVLNKKQNKNTRNTRKKHDPTSPIRTCSGTYFAVKSGHTQLSAAHSASAPRSWLLPQSQM